MEYTYDISLYGHLTKDIILKNFKTTYTLGAMANVWECLTTLNDFVIIQRQYSLL